MEETKSSPPPSSADPSELSDSLGPSKGSSDSVGPTKGSSKSSESVGTTERFYRCLACFHPTLRREETLRCNHGIYADHLTIWHSFLPDEDGSRTLHASPGHSRLTFCALRSIQSKGKGSAGTQDETLMKRELIEETMTDEPALPPPLLLKIGVERLEPARLNIVLCARMLLSFFRSFHADSGGRLPGPPPFLQGSFPLYCLESHLKGNPPEWQPKDLDFFVPQRGQTKFKKILIFLRRNFPIEILSTTRSQHRFAMVYESDGDSKIRVPVDITHLKEERTREDVRRASDLDICGVQIIPPSSSSSIDGFKIIHKGFCLVGDHHLLTAVLKKEMVWRRAPKPRGFLSILQGLAGSFHGSSLSTKDLTSLTPDLPSDLLDLMREVKLEDFGIKPEPIKGCFSRIPGPTTLLPEPQDDLMGGTVRLCPTISEDPSLHYYLDFSNRVWLSDGSTLVCPGLHTSCPQGNISILDLLAFLLLQKEKHKDALITPFYSGVLYPQDKPEPSGMTALTLLRNSLTPEDLGLYFICDHCGLELKGACFSDRPYEFDICASCAEPYRQPYYRHFYDHKAEALVQRSVKRYYASVDRRDKYRERGYRMKRHIAENPFGENLEYE